VAKFLNWLQICSDLILASVLDVWQKCTNDQVIAPPLSIENNQNQSFCDFFNDGARSDVKADLDFGS
jgi:hypothetical protein